MKRLILLSLLIFFPVFALAANVQQLIQLSDYVGVDYAGAVDKGVVVNAAEYAEMHEFSIAISEKIAQLEPSEKQKKLAQQARQLTLLIENRAAAAEVKALSDSMRQSLISGYDVGVTPQRIPDLESARALYAQQCTSCHGVSGQGDGPMAASLNPSPTNFLHRERFQQRSLFGLYNTITHGVSGTAMKAFTPLTENERWSLAFYVGSLALTPQEQSQGEAFFVDAGRPEELTRLDFFTTHSMQEIEALFGKKGAAISAFLRTNPAPLFYVAGTQPLDFSLSRLAESVTRYQAGDHKAAYEAAVKAYLEGFELVEGNLNAVDVKLRKDIETNMTDYRNLIRHSAPVAEVVAKADLISEQLETAQNKLDTTALSGSAAFVSSLVILLREGLEALLVIAALAAFLIKTNRRDGLVYLYMGIVAALLLGGLTWVASNSVIDISGMQRELTEGLAALFAALVLFSVGFWMHSKTSATQWKAFIETSLKKHLGKKTLWGLAGLSFIAVYREMFEVVLFYQALWFQSTSEGHSMIVAGFLLALAILLILGWLILRYSTRLPLRQFFAVSGIFMFVLALVFTGKGIAALQEAGKLPLDPVNLPSIELLGIYPNLQGLGVQAALLVIAIILLQRNKSKTVTKA
ncbi:MAG: FTR1 family protein [gamma proteobacterium symbiont of Bathyaustriella thionipta]|nr:FTR1 family protein [gamma proteobacterium symbiont of Bathyaustriella thionipta]